MLLMLGCSGGCGSSLLGLDMLLGGMMGRVLVVGLRPVSCKLLLVGEDVLHAYT